MVYSSLAIVLISLILNAVPTSSLPITSSTPNGVRIVGRELPMSAVVPRESQAPISKGSKTPTDNTKPSYPSNAPKVLAAAPLGGPPGVPQSFDATGQPYGAQPPPGAVPSGTFLPNALPSGAVPPAAIPSSALNGAFGMPSATGVPGAWATVTVASPSGPTVYLLPGSLVSGALPSATMDPNAAAGAPPNNGGYYLCAPPGVSPPPGAFGIPSSVAPNPTGYPPYGNGAPPQASPTNPPQPNGGQGGQGGKSGQSSTKKPNGSVKTKTQFVTVTAAPTPATPPPTQPTATVVVQPGR
jgi:hypothetical protein